MDLFIAPGGSVRLVYGEELDWHCLGLITIRRASHIEPIKGGGWIADLTPVRGPTLGPFSRRSQALAAEIEWLEARLPALWGS